jgi:purine-nucleoside phosphorylase
MKSSPRLSVIQIIHQLERLPEIGLVLGSGFSAIAKLVKNPVIFDYRDIQGFPAVSVPGHAGQLIFGQIAKKDVVIMSGRVHYYEGHPMTDVTYGIQMLHQLGIKTLILTNAAGGINKSFKPGDFMVLTDHINFMGTNPIIGDKSGHPKFIDMTEVYNYQLRQKLLLAAKKNKLKMQQGVYLATTGPTYETPAEIRAYNTLGADAVGMSTVPEAIVARHLGITVVALSCITNMAAGVTGQQLSHGEVLDIAKAVGGKGAELVHTFIASL